MIPGSFATSGSGYVRGPYFGLCRIGLLKRRCISFLRTYPTSLTNYGSNMWLTHLPVDTSIKCVMEDLTTTRSVV